MSPADELIAAIAAIAEIYAAAAAAPDQENTNG